MKIYLVRHGQTDFNKEGRWQGRNGLPLNETGISQALALHEKLKDVKFDLVFSSPQERAVQTAEIATGITPITDERLDVFDLGTADSLKASEIKTIRGGLVPDPDHYEGMESVPDFISRIYDFMNDLAQTFKDQDITVLISGHKCTTGCMSAFIEGMPKDGNFLRLASKNGEFKCYDFPLKANEKAPSNE